MSKIEVASVALLKTILNFRPQSKLSYLKMTMQSVLTYMKQDTISVAKNFLVKNHYLNQPVLVSYKF